MISVVAASYNHRQYIERCLGSIAAQDVDDIELVWIDDHSADGSFEVLTRLLDSRRYRGRFARVIARRNGANRGAHYTLNLGCRLATRPMLSLVNTDDYYHPARLSTMLRSYDGQDHWFAFSNVVAVDDLEVPLPIDPAGSAVMFDPDRLIEATGSVSDALLMRQIAASTGNFMLTRSLFDALGGFSSLRYCHDWMLALNACWFCEPVLVRERLYFYRLHATNSFRALSGSAQADTDTARRSLLRRIMLGIPPNPGLPSPQRDPAGFWSAMERAGLGDMAHSVLFPYSVSTHMLDLPAS